MTDWLVIFGAQRKGRRVAHLLVQANFVGLAYRACDRTQVVNPALARARVGAHHCLRCKAWQANGEGGGPG